MDNEMGQLKLTRESPAGRDFPSALSLPSLVARTISQHAAEDPQRPAIVARDQLITFADLSEFIFAAGERFSQVGIGPQHRVALLVPRGIEGALLVLAVACHAQLVPLNPALTDAELAQEIARIGCDVLLSDVLRVGPLHSGASFTCSFGSGGELQLSLRHGEVSPIEGVPQDRIAFLLRSSGTTGEPKQIAVTHRNLQAMATKMACWFDISPADRIPCLLPLYYAAGLKTSLFVPLLIGASVGLPEADEAYDLATWFESIRPTILSLAPTSLRGLIDRLPRDHDSKFTGLRFAICGAAYLPDSLRRDAEQVLQVPVIEYYGLSEAGAMAANPAPPGKRKPGTVGLFVESELSLRLPDGTPACIGETGEIWLRGPSVTPGYVSSADRIPFGLESGWLATGDLGCIDVEGYLTIVGRSKELINRGGEKVSPYEVEKALLSHPDVAEAGVFAVAHPRLGENVAACVVLKSQATVREEDLQHHLAQLVAPFKTPRHIEIVSLLPRGPTGKVLRSELARQFAQREQPARIRPDRMLEHQIMAVWVRMLERADFGIDDDFFEAGGDSLLAADMLAEVEALAHKPLAQSQLTARLTIRGLVDAICSGLDSTRELLTCMREGVGVPAFFCHGDYTTRGLFALRLFELVNASNPVYLLHFYQDLHRPDLTIQEIAASYLPEIAKVYSGGPVIVAGYCNGGLVAWELTRQMEQAGYTVHTLLLIETPSLNVRPVFRLLHTCTRVMGYLLPGRFGKIVETESMRALWHRMRGHDTFRSLLQHAWSRLLRRFHAGRDQPASGNTPSPHWLYQRTLARYKPRRIKTMVICFVAREGSLMDTDHRYWERFCKRVICFVMPGAHHSIVTSEADHLAREIRRILVLFSA